MFESLFGIKNTHLHYWLLRAEVVCHPCTDLCGACVGCVNSAWPGALPLTYWITVISVDWSDWSDSNPRGRNPAAHGGQRWASRCTAQINRFPPFGLWADKGFYSVSWSSRYMLLCVQYMNANRILRTAELDSCELSLCNTTLVG